MQRRSDGILPVQRPEPATDLAGTVTGRENGCDLELDFPGRLLRLRVWEAKVGRVMLYLLDSNDPANGPADRG